MILSMTGYGKAESQIENRKLTVEIRSLNSKSMDLNMRLSPQLREYEHDIRTLLNQRLERGKVDVSIALEDPTQNGTQMFTPINKEAFRYYYRELRALQDEHDMPHGDLTAAILRMPDVLVKSEEQTLGEENKKAVINTVEQAIEAFRAFRIQEGKALEAMFREKLDGIEQLLGEVEPYEKGRVEKIRKHLIQNLDKLAEETKQRVDQNRLEAEMIYYLEKLDITEEKVRLTNHLHYFRETMDGDGTGVGKKLGFIAQEMGREINTLGSKSNQSEMQILVVKMKDILEQIKEQVLNVL